jgi:hypothetical protein
MTVAPIDLFASSIHLDREGRIRAGRRTADPDQDGWRLTAFHAKIVPRGRWHRIELDIPSNILAVTLPRGSRVERRLAEDGSAL